MQQLGWSIDTKDVPILKVPLHFHFDPVQILSKQLTKLNSTSPYRIYYLGPRFNNSFLFHKMYSQKHGYQYDLIKVNKNNNFFSESMTNNQFYRNEIYYRAFEGMNPTLDSQNQLIFDSKFQSGNLDCVVKIGQSEYDLFLRIDSNTRGHLFWYYFSVTNAKPGETVKFNICNLTKSKSLYQKNFKPYTCRQNIAQENDTWSQDKVENVTYQNKKLRYNFIYDKISKSRKFYELSFTYTFSNKQQLAKFAYCIPYTYSELNRQLKQLESIAQIGKLGKSLTGVDIPLVRVGKDQPEQRKPVVLVTGRIHPGQSNGSILLSGFMKFLCFSQQAQFLRKKVIFLIVPMLNPDGVIIGNSRTGASGKDLNRQFRSSNNYLFPEVSLLKKLVNRVLHTHQIDIYLDFHGHSVKKNLFVFGPHYNITQLEYYRSRIFPKILSNITPIFRYFGSNFTIPQGKKTTARAVMFNQFAIPLVYTIQCSIGLYRDYQTHKDLPFKKAQWEILGQNIVLSIKQYFDDIQQYQSYLEQRKISKIKQKIPDKNKQKQSEKMADPNIKKVLNLNKPKNLKIIKIFQEIKILEQKAQKKKAVQDNQSEGSSDSQNQEQDLQKMKMKEFQCMISDGVQYQNQINSKKNQYKKDIKSHSLVEPVKIKRRQRKSNKIQQVNFIEDFINHISPPKFIPFTTPRTLIKSQRNPRQKNQEQFHSIQPKIKLEKICKQKQIPSDYEQNIKFFAQDVIHYSQKGNKQSIPVPKQNVTIYNFSKMIQNPKSVRYNEFESQEKSKFIQSKKKHDTINQIPESLFYRQPKLNKVNFLNNLPDFTQFRSIESKQYHRQQVQTSSRNIKNRNAYPPSFYRIKYQNRNRKRKHQQSQKSNSKQNQQFSAYQSFEERGHNFLNIKKVNKH